MSLKDNFPEAKQVAILFTGGVESFLVGKLAIEKYGIENVIFVLYTMDEYNIFYRNDEKVKRIKRDFRESVIDVGGYKELIIDNEEYQRFDGWLADRTWKIILDHYPDVEYMFGGYNNIHKECYDLFEEIDFPNSNNPSKEARLIVASDKTRYPELWDTLYKCEGVIYFIEDDYTHKDWRDIESMYRHDKLIAPLMDHKKEDVLIEYKNLNLLEKVYNTKSCNVDNTILHCGICKNCLSRKLAFEKAGIEDRTKYEL